MIWMSLKEVSLLTKMALFYQKCSKNSNIVKWLSLIINIFIFFNKKF